MKTGETVKILRSYKQGKARVLCHDLKVIGTTVHSIPVDMEYTLTDNELQRNKCA